MAARFRRCSVPIQVHFGWQTSFCVFGFLGVVWGGYWYRWFRDYPSEKAGLELRSGNLWRLMAIAACFVYTLTFFLSWFQTYLVKGRGYSEDDLVLSSLPYLVGACGNLAGGVTSDWLVRRLGLKTGRRMVGVAGLGAAAIFLTATILMTNNTLVLIFLSLVYGGLTFQL